MSSRAPRRATSSSTSTRSRSSANRASISARSRSVGDTRLDTGVGPPSSACEASKGTYVRRHLHRYWDTTSTFSSVRLRTRVTKGPGSKAAGLAMAFKLLEAAQDRWRSVNGPHLVALVRAGARFDKGVMVERPDEVQEVAA